MYRKTMFQCIRTPFLASALCLGLLSSAQAAFTIAPLGSVLRTGPSVQQVQEVYTVTNPSKSDLQVEVNVLDWAQNEDGLSLYKESDDFVVYPRQLNIKAGAQRTVRILRKADAAPVSAQAFYRVQVRELAKKLELGAMDGSQVFITTRVLVPVIVQPEAFKGVPDVSVSQTAKGLRINNSSSALAKFSELFCGQERIAGLTYVQPGISFLVPDVKCSMVTVHREGVEPTDYAVAP